MDSGSPQLVAAFYRFAPLEGLGPLRAELQQLGTQHQVLGTVCWLRKG